MSLSLLYRLWQHSRDKGNEYFYSDEGFREDYTEQQLPRKQQMVLNLVQEELHEAVMSADRYSYSVLSLGCGPGSDVLAFMQGFQSVCQQENLESLRVKFTGVDQHDWPMDKFRQRCALIELAGPISDFPFKLYSDCSMEEYVTDICSTGKVFDFIVLSFAEVKNKIELVGQRLPQLLRDEEGSRIFVIDNDIPPVRQLEDFGFQRTTSLPGTVCMVFNNGRSTSESSSSEDSDPGGYWY